MTESADEESGFIQRKHEFINASELIRVNGLNRTRPTGFTPNPEAPDTEISLRLNQTCIQTSNCRKARFVLHLPAVVVYVNLSATPPPHLQQHLTTQILPFSTERPAPVHLQHTHRVTYLFGVVDGLLLYLIDREKRRCVCEIHASTNKTS